MTSKKRGICTDCGRTCYIDHHHEPPKCSGGVDTVPLCRECHKRRHINANHFAQWGKRGGQITAQNPIRWLRNLKQFRNRTDLDELAERYQPKIRQLKLPF